MTHIKTSDPRRIDAGQNYAALNSAGMTYSQIASRYGVTRGQVSNDIALFRREAQNSQNDEPRDGFIVNGNQATAESKRVKTLDQLIETCKIDLSVWKVDRHEINKWEVGRRATEKNITMTNGVSDGYTRDSGRVNVEPLYQVKAWLSKREPEAVKPVIQPITVHIKHRAVTNAKREGLKIAITLPDPQFGFSATMRGKKLTPFHDRTALSVAFQLMEYLEPEKIIWLGDVNDFTMWSDKFIHRPEFYFTTQPALIEASWSIGKSKLYADDVEVLEGNHDIRPEKMMMVHLAEGYGLRPGDQIEAPAVMSIDNLLGLSRMGVKYAGDYPNGAVWINNNTKVVHGDVVRGGAGVTSKAVVSREYDTMIFGHIHKIEMAMKTIRTRSGLRYVTAFSPGCLCHIDGRVPGSTVSDQWQNGVGIVYYNDDYSTIVPVPIENGRAFFDGVAFDGKDYTDELTEQTGWEY